MSSTFAGLNTALSSLFAHQRALGITGQNVANANTDGYSRQRVDMRSVGGSVTPAMFSTSPGIGQGVNSDKVTRSRDQFLESRAHTEHALTSNLSAQQTTLDGVEKTFGEPSENGLQALMADYWAGWGDISNAPDDLAARSQMVQAGATLADGMHTARASLDAQWNGEHVKAQALVDDINSTAKTVADLNKAIIRATQSGLPSNELADQRDALIVNLAEKTGATARPGKDGTVDVYLAGTTLVRGGDAQALRLDGATDPDNSAAGNPPKIVWAKDGYPATITGELGASVTAMTTTIPAYRDRLDAVANEIVTQVNNAHANGYDLNGNPGGALFLGGPPVTAANITINPAVVADPALVAASSQPTVPPAKPSKDGGNADAIAMLGTGPASPDTAYRRMITDLGVQTQGVTRGVAIQSAITLQVDAARESVSGVSIDEEMTNMVAYQHGYEAAGRLMTAIDEMLDTLINRTGTVGR